MKTILLAAAVALTALGPHRVGQAGVTVALPTGWHNIPLVLPAATDGNDPVTRIVLASGPVSFGQCNDVSYVFPRDAVAIVVLEWRRPTPGRFASRPRRFTPRNLPVRAPPAVECHAGPGGSVQFEDHGRRFAAFVLLGPSAPTTLAARARAVLDTLRVR
jgi:hypothetical protein